MTIQDRNSLAEVHLPVVNRAVGNLAARLPHIDREDLFGMGQIALLEALECYDPARGELPKYLYCKTRFGILDAVREEQHSRTRDHRRPPMGSLDEVKPKDNWDLTDAVTVAQVFAAAEHLPARHQIVLKLYFGPGITLREIGQKLHVAECRAYQILQDALTKIRERLSIKCSTCGLASTTLHHGPTDCVPALQVRIKELEAELATIATRRKHCRNSKRKARGAGAGE
jgi:RNA polymerase sigma factor (sigma-70 family)